MVDKQAGLVRCLATIRGTVDRARGLMNTKLISKNQPRCYVKGIKGNSNLVTFYCTGESEGNHPTWDEEWEYDCLTVRSRDEFVGLKFVVYNGEEFLGGTDFDLSEIAAYQTVEEELELTGIVLHKAKGYQPKKARLFISVAVERKMLPMFGQPQAMLQASMKSITGVTSICGRIIRARGLCPDSQDKRSWPMMFVRGYLNSGKVVDMFHSKAVKEIHDPTWNETFEYDFEDDPSDQPLILIFDIFGTAGMSRADHKGIWEKGNHLGSAMLSVDSIGDEDAFLDGRGRHRLRLLGDCQLLRKRLDIDGIAADAEGKEIKVKEKKEGDDDDAPQKSRLQVAAMQAKAAFKDPKGTVSGVWEATFARAAKEVDTRYHVTVEVFCERASRPMPYSELLGELVTVEASDLGEIQNDPELLEVFGGFQDVKRLQITAEERICSIYGKVVGATDLIGADATGRSDPYCIVQAITKAGDVHFAYRTRVIKACLNPEWNEGFFFHVPPDPDNPRIPVCLAKVQFSIYDSDEGQAFEALRDGDEDDDFLGHCGVDVANMRNSDFLLEDVPLLGAKSRPGGGGKAGTAFRRYSTVSVEVRVERRICRILDPRQEFDPDLLQVPRHHESRPMHPPEFKGYRDVSQQTALNDPGSEFTIAGQIVHFKDNNVLAKMNKDRKYSSNLESGWMQIPAYESQYSEPEKPEDGSPSKKKPLFEVEDPEMHLRDSSNSPKGRGAPVSYRRDYKSLSQNWENRLTEARADKRDLDYVDRLPPMVRTSSLPMLSTRFGENYVKNIMDPFEEHAKRMAMHRPPGFKSQAISIRNATQSMNKKPLLGEYSMRTLRKNASASML